MPENLQEKNTESEKVSSDKKKSSLDEDQKTKSYYYDDAHGYEIYEPEDDEEDCESSFEKTSDSSL